MAEDSAAKDSVKRIFGELERNVLLSALFYEGQRVDQEIIAERIALRNYRTHTAAGAIDPWEKIRGFEKASAVRLAEASQRSEAAWRLPRAYRFDVKHRTRGDSVMARVQSSLVPGDTRTVSLS